MPVRDCSPSSNSASHFWLSRVRLRVWSSASSKPSRMVPPSAMLLGNSSARLRSRVAEIESKLWMRSAMAATGESGNSRRVVAMAGSAKRVSRTPPSSRGLCIRLCSRLRMRSMSRTPLSRFCISLARPGAVTNSPTQFWRRLISSRSSSGAQSQRSSKRAPGAVTVPSIAASREPWRVLAADLKISKLRSVAGSSRRVRSLLYSLIFRRFSGLAQRVSVA